MKVLFLARHAKAAATASSGDIDRKLTTRGQANAKKVAKRLLAAGAVPEVIICSPARRARETAQIFASRWGLAADRLVVVEAVYQLNGEAPQQFLQEVVHKIDEQYESAMIVGHDPTMTALAQFCRRTFVESLPTCSVVEFAFRNRTWDKLSKGRGVVQRFETAEGPRIEGAQASAKPATGERPLVVVTLGAKPQSEMPEGEQERQPVSDDNKKKDKKGRKSKSAGKKRKDKKDPKEKKGKGGKKDKKDKKGKKGAKSKAGKKKRGKSKKK